MAADPRFRAAMIVGARLQRARAARLRPCAQGGRPSAVSATTGAPCAAVRSVSGSDAKKRRGLPLDWRLVESITTRPPKEEDRLGQVYRIGRARAKLHAGRVGPIGPAAEDTDRGDQRQSAGGFDPGDRG